MNLPTAIPSRADRVILFIRRLFERPAQLPTALKLVANNDEGESENMLEDTQAVENRIDTRN